MPQAQTTAAYSMGGASSGLLAFWQNRLVKAAIAGESEETLAIYSKNVALIRARMKPKKEQLGLAA